MRYFYLLDYPSFARPELELDLHARMYIMGDKYDVPDLRKVAARKFAHWCEELSRNPQGKKAAVHINYFLRVVVPAYKDLPETDRTLRKPFTKGLARFLNASPDLLNHEHYRDMCLEYPLFGLDMQTESLFATHAGEPGWRVEEE